MARHGRCRCGKILRFRLKPWGYKKRCPQCGAVVRLRVGQRPRTKPRPNPAPVPVRPAEASGYDVELWPTETGPANSLGWYWFWVGLTVVFSLLVILALIWFLLS
jgi:hypothetical protein